jgi:hypothetical protein
MRKESLFEELFLLHQVSDLRSGDPSRTGGVIKTGGRQWGAAGTIQPDHELLKSLTKTPRFLSEKP